MSKPRNRRIIRELKAPDLYGKPTRRGRSIPDDARDSYREVWGDYGPVEMLAGMIGERAPQFAEAR